MSACSFLLQMGTFTKAFGSCGGYIAGSHALIKYIRYVRKCAAPQTGSLPPGFSLFSPHNAPAGTAELTARAHSCPAQMAPSIYATTMSPPAAQQALSALHVLQGKDGTDRGVRKIRELHDNSNFFRNSLRAMGCEVLGDEDSPVMPIMLYQPAKIAAFSRECLKRNIAVVVVGFPATPLLLGRTRVCISASHSREDLEAALEVFRDVINLLVRRIFPLSALICHRVPSWFFSD